MRGLDYYTRTTFEFYVAGRRGQQQALGGGGRYDGLAELLGGQPTPGIGFGIGIDRTVLAAGGAGDRRAGRRAARRRRLSRRCPRAAPARGGTLREAGLRVRADGTPRKLGKQLESAAKLGARYAVIVGAATDRVILRDLEASEQREMPLAEVAAAIG